MFVGVLRLEISIPSARSLKDKRRVVLSFKERTQARMRVAIAEVGNLDDWRRATFGVSCVANEAAHCEQVLSEVAHAAETLRDAVLTGRATEIVSFGHGGSSIAGGQTFASAVNSDDEDDEGEPYSAEEDA